MVSKKAMKIGACGLAVAIVAIGLGVGLSSKSKSSEKEISAAQAQGVEQCRRLIDGTNNQYEVVAAKSTLRKLQWENDGYAPGTNVSAPASKGSEKGSSKGEYMVETSKGEYIAESSKGEYIPVCSNKGSAVNLCGNSAGQSVSKGSEGSCGCVAQTGSNEGAKGSKGSELVPVPCGCTNPIPVAPSICMPVDQISFVPAGQVSLAPKPWGGDGHSTPAPTPCEARKFFLFDNICTNQAGMESDSSYNSLTECCDMNAGIFVGMSCQSVSVDICNPAPVTSTPAPTPCEAQVFFFEGGICTNQENMGSGTPYTSLTECCDMAVGMGSFTAGTCNFKDICNVYPVVSSPPPVFSSPAPTPCEAQVFFFDGSICTNDVFMTGDSYGSVTMCCDVNFGSGSFTAGNCDYVDVCNTPQPNPVPTTPAPTPCEGKPFFFDGAQCTNEVFPAGGVSYYSVVECCDVNFGSGSLVNGSCNYTDDCNSGPPSPSPDTSLTNPPSGGSTPTVSTEVTGPPTLPDRSS